MQIIQFEFFQKEKIKLNKIFYNMQTIVSQQYLY